MKLLSAPFSITWSITNECNLECKHCFASSRKKLPNEMDTEEIFRMADILADEAKVFNLVLTGGEIFLRKDIFDILDYVAKKHFILGMNTNATLITDEVSRRLAGYKMKGRILAGFDGASEESYGGLRGKNIFKHAVKGIENLTRHNKNVELFCVVNRNNFRELRQVVKTAKELGARCLEFNMLMPGGRAGCNPQIDPTGHEKRFAMEELCILQEEFKGFVGGSFCRWAKSAKELLDDGYKNLPKRWGKLQPCGACVNTCALRPDGELIPCYCFWDMTAGNLRERSFHDIWKNSPVFERLRELHKVSLKEIEKCEDCKYNEHCNAGCRASAYYATRDLLSYDPKACYQLVEEGACV